MEILKWVAIRQLVKMKKSIKKFKGVNITQNKPFQWESGAFSVWDKLIIQIYRIMFIKYKSENIHQTRLYSSIGPKTIYQVLMYSSIWQKTIYPILMYSSICPKTIYQLLMYSSKILASASFLPNCILPKCFPISASLPDFPQNTLVLFFLSIW